MLSTILGTILGGLVAGLVGLLSAYLSRHLDRRERHLNEHKDNLKLIVRALNQLKNEVWPFHYGAEELKLASSAYSISDYLLQYGLLGVQLIDTTNNDHLPEVKMVDRILYEDMKKHYLVIYRSLDQFEELIRTKGQDIVDLINEISVAIFRAMDESEFQVLEWTYDKGVKTQMRDLKGRIEEQDYAGIIFLFAIEDAEENWPNRINSLKRYDLYNGLKETGLQVKKENEDKINRMKRNLDEINGQEKLCTDLIKKELRSWKLKGHCEFV